MPCKPKSYPANSIRHAYSRYEYVAANTIGVFRYHLPLKVDGNEKRGRSVSQLLSGIMAIGGYLKFERAVSL